MQFHKTPALGTPLFAVLLCTLSLLQSIAHSAEIDPGRLAYNQQCAACHDHPEETRARPLDSLQRMIPSLVEFAINEGKMKIHADPLSDQQRADLLTFLTGQSESDNSWIAQMMCSAKNRRVDTNASAIVPTFGIGPKNHRYLTSEASGLDNADLETLELAWAFAFPNVTMMRSQPAIVGNTLFITPVESSQLYALNIADEPCVQWVYETDRQLRTAVTFGIRSTDQRPVLTFGDMAGRLHMVDASTGEALWFSDLRLFPETIITGTPQLVGNRVYASISQFEIMIGRNPAHECCKSHGAVAALDAMTGERIWVTHTMPEAKPVRDRGDGEMIWGPSGAPIWTSPAIDLKRGVLYVGTGEATSEPAHDNTDAILAIDLDDGNIRWSFQATANDIFLAGCGRGSDSLNCPPETSVNRDVDFGASVIIATGPDGNDILLAGQKSSDVWALDPDKDGEVLWHWNNGRGTANGGVHWGMAFDGTKVYVGLSDPGKPRPGFVPQPGLYALNVDDGTLAWEHRTQAACENRDPRLAYCDYLYGYSGATLALGNAVVQGSLDGYLNIFDAASGKRLFQYDTVRDYEGVNGVKGMGGSIDNASLTAANGMLFVNSGYGMFGQTAGNVLLAFKPKLKPKQKDKGADSVSN